MQVEYTVGEEMKENPYHIKILRTRLKHALPLLVPEVYDEVDNAFNELIPRTGGEIRTSQH